MFMLSLFTLLLLLLSSLVKADACLSIKPLIEKAGEKFLPKFPHHYNIGLAKTETNCKWLISKDGHGSVGYFQLTPKFLDQMLKPYFPKYTEPHPDHFYAFAFYLKHLYNTTPSGKLWVVYQRYNGGNHVLQECSGVYEWSLCKARCKRGMMCVLRIGGECKQYRNACDINYEYSVKVYKNGLIYKTKDDTPYVFW